MTFVAHVPDPVVTDLVYRFLPSWPAVGCYFDWRKHYAAEQLKKAGIGRRRRDGSVLTEQGWVLPSGPLNPRVIEGSTVPVALDREQEAIDAHVNQQQEDHEVAVLHDDLFVFGKQWDAVRGGRAERIALQEIGGESVERHAFIRKWAKGFRGEVGAR